MRKEQAIGTFAAATCLALLSVTSLLATSSFWFRVNQKASVTALSVQTIKTFLLDRIDFGPGITLRSVSPLLSLDFPGFAETQVQLTQGDQTLHYRFYIRRDDGYLFAGRLYELNGKKVDNEIIQAVRGQFPGSSAHLRITSYKESIFPSLLAVTVRADIGGYLQRFFVTRDKRTLLVGSVSRMTGDPSPKQIMEAISTRNEPSEGAAGAPVTIVEYSDLECPSCAELQSFLQKQLLPSHSTFRVVFKQFPLAYMHPWAWRAATAARCVYHIAPSKYVSYTATIFARQRQFQEEYIQRQLLQVGKELGINSRDMSACMKSEIAAREVQSDILEGQSIGVASTPTMFVNGEVFIGTPALEKFNFEVNRLLSRSPEIGCSLDRPKPCQVPARSRVQSRLNHFGEADR